MSSVQLQRVLVRMLYDPDFAAAVHGDAGSALRDCGLQEREQAWILAADRRAFGLDPYRRGRSLLALVEEFPLSSGFVLRDAGPSRLDAFFSSAGFHAGMSAGRSLALLYGAYLGTLALQPAERAILELEGAVARIRRVAAADSGEHWTWAAGAGVHIDCSVDLSHYAAHVQRLRAGGSVLERLLDGAATLTAGAACAAQTVLVRTRPDTHLEAISDDIASVLALLERGAGATDLSALALSLGASESELETLLAELMREGFLVRARSGEPA